MIILYPLLQLGCTPIHDRVAMVITCPPGVVSFGRVCPHNWDIMVKSLEYNPPAIKHNNRKSPAAGLGFDGKNTSINGGHPIYIPIICQLYPNDIPINPILVAGLNY